MGGVRLEVPDVEYRRTMAGYLTMTFPYAVADSLFGAVYVAAMGTRNLPVTYIGIVLGVGSAALAILDYPSGNVADSWGRKKTVILGFLVWGVSLIAYGKSTSMGGFVVSMVVWALGVALISGVPQSWIVDELIRQGKRDRLKGIMPLTSSLSVVLRAFAAMGSGWLSTRDIGVPLLAGGLLAMATAVALMFLLRENYGDRVLTVRQSVLRNTKALLGNPTMRFLLLKSGTARVVFQVFVMTWQLYVVQSLGLPLSVLGVILTLLMLTLAAGNALAGLLMRLTEPLTVSLAGYIVVGFGMGCLALFPTLWAFVVGAICFELGLGLDGGAAQVWVHHYIPSKQRASYLSALSSAGSVVGICVPPLNGLLIQICGFGAAWLVALVASTLTLCVLVILARQKVEVATDAG